MSCEPTSNDFDPLLALYSDKTAENTSTKVKVFDNVAVFEANLNRKETKEDASQSKKQTRRDKSFSQRKKIAAEVQNRDLSKLKEMMEQRKKLDEAKDDNVTGKKVVTPSASSKRGKPPSNVFVLMDKLSDGPFNLLHRITTNRLRCNVYTRNFRGLRGMLVGYVLVFDRYMNLAMVDVDETFAVAPLGAVADHQKKVSIPQLEKAIKHVRINGLEADKPESIGSKPGFSRTSKLRHRATTGVSFVKRSVKEKRIASQQLSQSEASTSSTSKENFTVRRYDLRDPPKPSMMTFHGGSAQFYHRHINNLYVRGDSIVLISLPS